jgi:hypothetical protein
MKLYEVPNNSKIRVISNIHTPLCSIRIDENSIINFHHIDGMYSYCTNSKGEVVHLSGTAEVEIIAD